MHNGDLGLCGDLSGGLSGDLQALEDLCVMALVPGKETSPVRLVNLLS